MQVLGHAGKWPCGRREGPHEDLQLAGWLCLSCITPELGVTAVCDSC